MVCEDLLRSIKCSHFVFHRRCYIFDIINSNSNWVRIRVRLRVALFQHFSRRITKTSTLSSTNFTQGNTLLKELTQTMNNKIKLHILGVAMNKLGNQLINMEYNSRASAVEMNGREKDCSIRKRNVVANQLVA